MTRTVDLALWKQEWPWCVHCPCTHGPHSFEKGGIGYEIHVEDARYSHKRTCMHCGTLKFTPLELAVYLAVHTEEAR
jgi:hypothetical protein